MGRMLDSLSHGHRLEGVTTTTFILSVPCIKHVVPNEFAYTTNLYYYSSRVPKNLSSKFDEFLPARSQFDSDHRVHFSTPTSCQSATFVRPLFAFVLCFFTTKNHEKTTNAMKAYRSA